MDPKSIIWSDQVYTLKSFKSKKFPLPQVVRVEDGYYGGDDEMTLSNGDVLTIHLQKKIRSYKAVIGKGDEVYIPVSMDAEVEVTPSDEPEIYNSVDGLVRCGVERVEWIHSTPWLNVEEGDVLQVHDIVNKKGMEYLRMSFVSKTQSAIFVPLNYRATFKSASKRTMWLTEVESQFSLPVTIKFIDQNLGLKPKHKTDTNKLSRIADLGEITLLGVEEKDVLIASVQNEDVITVIKIPLQMDITIRAGVGVGVEQDDYTYVDVCTKYHNRACLEQLDDTTLDSIRIGDIEATVESIYEYVYVPETPPEIPSREGRPPLRPTPTNNDTGDDDDMDEEKNVPTQTFSSPRDDEIPLRSEPEPSSEKMDDRSKPPPSNPREKKKVGKVMNFFLKFKKTKGKRAQTYDVPSNERGKEAQELQNQSSSFTNPYIGDELRGNKLSESYQSGNKPTKEIPKNLESLSCEEVCQCLKMLNMQKHIETFHEQQIDGSLLVELTQDEFISLGVNDPFEKKKLTKFIGGWRPLNN